MFIFVQPFITIGSLTFNIYITYAKRPVFVYFFINIFVKLMDNLTDTIRVILLCRVMVIFYALHGGL